MFYWWGFLFIVMTKQELIQLIKECIQETQLEEGVALYYRSDNNTINRNDYENDINGTLQYWKDRKEIVVDFDFTKTRLEDIIVCGKTGTVQNPHGKDHSVFIAFAPLDNPKIAIAVFIENSGYGGTWAAPTASLVIEKYLKGKISNEGKEKRIMDAKLSNIENDKE